MDEITKLRRCYQLDYGNVLTVDRGPNNIWHLMILSSLNMHRTPCLICYLLKWTNIWLKNVTKLCNVRDKPFENLVGECYRGNQQISWY